MANYPDADTAIYAKLGGTAALTALVSTRIYNTQAPSGATLPYVVFYAPSIRQANTDPRDTFNDVYRVEAVGATRASAMAVHQAIYDTLHEQELTLSGWDNYWMANEGVIPLIDNVSGAQYWRFIGEYRVKLSKQGA